MDVEHVSESASSATKLCELLSTLSTSEHSVPLASMHALHAVSFSMCVFAVSESDSFYFQQATTDVTSRLMHNTDADAGSVSATELKRSRLRNCLECIK